MKPLPTTPSALTFARLLGEGPMARVALEASLNELSGPAFIASSRGTVLHANTAGARRAASAPDAVRGKLAAVVASPSKAAEERALVTPLKCAAGPAYYLVVFPPPSSAEVTLASVGSLWELTNRQRDVLRLLLDGFSNKTIAVKLGCAERTVETHLTAIFAKSGHDGRSSLLAALARQRS